QGRVDERLATLQPRTEHVPEHFHDRTIGFGLADVMDADRAYQLTVDEYPEFVAIGCLVQIVRDQLVIGFLDEAMQPVGLVPQVIDRLEILPAFAAAILGLVEKLLDLACEGTPLRQDSRWFSLTHGCARLRQLRKHSRPRNPVMREGMAIVKYVNF